MHDFLKKTFVILGMVFVVWVLILIWAIDVLFQGFYGWAGFCGGILAFGLSALSLALWKTDGDRDTTEISAIPQIFTSVYFTAALVANTVFCFLAYREFPRVIPIAVNAVLTIAFVAVRMFVLPYRNRVLRTAARTAEKTCGTIRLSAKLGELMAITQDAAVNQQLRDLKERLDYSTNVSQAFTEDLETLFFDQLCDISNAMDQHDPVEDVLRKIEEAQRTWKMRNGASFTN